jgi:hypothetical protein
VSGPAGPFDDLPARPRHVLRAHHQKEHPMPQNLTHDQRRPAHRPLVVLVVALSVITIAAVATAGVLLWTAHPPTPPLPHLNPATIVVAP